MPPKKKAGRPRSPYPCAFYFRGNRDVRDLITREAKSSGLAHADMLRMICDDAVRSGWTYRESFIKRDPKTE